ncbi:hypothetical protein J7E38_18880 [Bacillus sp. ISL-35]|uniref:hypothetical protein n=1 Tax=Bacillus sp. ISL-35 TaxID=2819122 RepID=UPI001BEBB2CE|nr:hypothetical protein [Bacillus sp. ISL-35]MBT2681059.1 hypothetical protein [Bacillus sp. ISL-35]MBT2705379.1 hypothetical protein [Chryseobacterium sp. ISL-80]
MKTILLGISALLLLAVIVGWNTYKSYRPTPPDLEMIVDKQTVEVKAATYSLRKWGRAAAADANTDPALFVRETPPIKVGRNDSINMQFEHSPVSVTCYLWDMETGGLAYKSLDGLPLDLAQLKVSSGDYAMEIRAKWEVGYALYNTRIQVNEE